MATRLPIPGSDDGQWGTILNDFLGRAHDGDGSLKPIDHSKVVGLAPVAISGSYSDLTGKPAIPTTAADVSAVAATNGITTIRQLSQAAYDALGTKDPNTLYIIVG